MKPGGTTEDGAITLEDVQCIAACTEAPCLQVNYRYRYRVTLGDVRSARRRPAGGRLADEVPPHGTLATVRQQIPADRWANTGPEAQAEVDERHPGMTVTNAPLIVSSRFEQADGHTLAGYQRTGGYSALRKALGMDPSAVTDEVKAATLLGRGGAGFPAGTKWGFLPPNVLPRYVVVNGDESEPGTYKDRILMERDPHQLIEGLLICCYAVGAAQAFLYVRGEMALAQERIAAALNEAYEAGLRRQGHHGLGLLGRHRPALGRRRVHRRRGDRAHREPRGRAGHAAAEAAVLPGDQGPLHAADDRQQRRDAWRTCRGSSRTAAPRSPRSATASPPARACSPCPDT